MMMTNGVPSYDSGNLLKSSDVYQHTVRMSDVYLKLLQFLFILAGLAVNPEGGHVFFNMVQFL